MQLALNSGGRVARALRQRPDEFACIKVADDRRRGSRGLMLRCT